jgi:cytochrome c553
MLIFSLALSASVGANAQDAKTKAAACGACHGPDGNSVNPDWPKLAGQHPDYIVTQLEYFKSGQRKNVNMNAMAAPLSPEDMADVAAYFSSQTLKIGSVDAATAAAGAGLYRGGNKTSGVPACMACHGPNGAGNPAAKMPSLRGQHAKYTTTQLLAYKNGERAAGQASIMATIASRLTAQEIEQVAAYLEGLH